ncbi:MAG TPA: thiamine pyrophosphate-dependent enzyme [Terriglobales bacterium]|jgi:hypothetical protein|nr:thiamine pyrophosphate-dependent enzyme [Terriglobales bacterium]
MTHLIATSVSRPEEHHPPIISAEKLKQLYTLMVRLSSCEQKRKGARGKRRALYFGVACEVAAVIDLRSGDAVATLASQHIGQLACDESSINGTDEKTTATGWSVLEDGSRERLAIAAGVALAYRIQHQDNVVIAFASLREIARAVDSVRLAQQQSLPIIYLEKVGTNVRKSGPTPHHLPTIPVDHGDGVAVYRVAHEAIDKARRGAGPTLIQCIENDSHEARNRLKSQRADPIAYMEHYLRKQNIWSDELRR